MKIDGVNLINDSEITDAVIEFGATLPTGMNAQDQGRLFVLTAVDGGNQPGLYYYSGSAWVDVNDNSTVDADLLDGLDSLQFLRSDADDTYTGNLTITGKILNSLGTAALPTYSFDGDPNTGIYSPSLDNVAVTVGGTEVARFNTNGLEVRNSTSLYLQSGTAANPSLRFSVDTDTGIYRNAADQLSFSTGGTERVTITTTSMVMNSIPILGPVGSAAAPSYSFSGDTDTGMYRSGINTTSFSSGGTRVLGISTSGIEANAVPFIGSSGSAATPTYSFTGDSDTGAYSSGTNEYSIATGGARRLLVADSGLYTVDGTAALPSYSFTSDGNTGMYRFLEDHIGFATNGTHRLSINPNGRILIGSVNTYTPAGINSVLQINGTNADSASLYATRWSVDSNPSYLILGKSRGAAIGTFGILNSSDIVGSIRFAADNGANISSTPAEIQCVMDGTPSLTSTPGMLRFGTTPSGNTASTVKMTISASGQLDVYNGAMTMVIGADSGVNTRTNATYKAARVGLPHYTNSEEPLALIVGSSNVSISEVAIGGGSSSNNAATRVSIWAAANTTTTTGTEVGRFNVDQFLTVDGTSSLPGISFMNDQNTGIHRITSDEFGFSAGGLTRMSISTTKIDVLNGGLGVVLGADSAATTRTNATLKYGRLGIPHYTNAEEPLCAIFGTSDVSNNTIVIGGGTILYNAATQVSVYAAANTTTQSGTEVARFNLNQFLTVDGSDTAPGFSFIGDPDSGMFQYTSSPNTLGFSTGGVERVYIDSAGATYFNEFVYCYQEIYTDVGFIGNNGGSVTAAMFTKFGDENTGMYFPANDQVGFTAGGTLRLSISSSGISANSHKITDLATPTTGNDATNKTYVDGRTTYQSYLTINQTSHGFSTGTPVYFNGTNWALAKADAAATIGTHIAVNIDTNNFYAVSYGAVTTSGLTAGEWYFVSEATAGTLTTTEPTSGFSNPLGQALSTTVLMVMSLRAQEI